MCQGGTSGSSKVYIDRIEVKPAAVPKKQNPESITVIVKNVTEVDCGNGIVSLSFSDTAGNPLPGIGTPVKNGLTFVRGETLVAFLPPSDFDLRALDVGVYDVKAALTCPGFADQKKVFFTVRESEYEQIPETD